MFDMKIIRDDPDGFDSAQKNRGGEPVAKKLIELDDKRRAHVSSLQSIQTRRNKASEEIGQAKSKGDEQRAQELIAEISKCKSEVQTAEEEERRLTLELKDELSRLPNLPLDDVPVGTDENSNQETHKWGSKPELSFEPKEHFEIGEGLGCMDFETASRMSGSRFVVLKGKLAALERVLGQFMIEMHTREHGYTEVATPLLVRDAALTGTGQLPKFEDDQFKASNDLWLIPTAEVTLTNLVSGQIVDAESLPQRVTALTQCFRLEAGAAGRDVRGMLRQHQFQKCELVSITKPEDSEKELARMLQCAEKVLQLLNLHYRVVTLCTGDMGFSARKTHDIEVWLPGADAYREISSCSVCGDFQARRMNARFRGEDRSVHFVHTLNGSGVAVGRALIAVLENYQNEDGSVTVPEVLRPYMNGLELLEA